MTAVLGTALLLAATVTTGMTAGLLAAFAHSVMPGLAMLDDRHFVAGFQRIDAAIRNPWMMLPFLGSPMFTCAAFVHSLVAQRLMLPWVVSAFALSVATVVITAVVHLPINAEVHEAAPSFSDTADLRARFETRWMPWNVVRTLSSGASFVALCAALVVAGRASG